MDDRRYIVVSRWDYAWGGNRHYVYDREKGRTHETVFASALAASMKADQLERGRAAVALRQIQPSEEGS